MYSLVDASLNTLHTIKWNICSDEKMSLLEKLGLVQGAKVSVIASYFGNVIVSVNGKRIAIEKESECSLGYTSLLETSGDIKPGVPHT